MTLFGYILQALVKHTLRYISENKVDINWPTSII